MMLNWYHFKCAGLVRKPKMKNWFVDSVTLMFRNLYLSYNFMLFYYVFMRAFKHYYETA